MDYSKGHSSWGEKGVYSRRELFEITPINSHFFKISKHLQIRYTAGNDGKTFIQDTIKLVTTSYPNISSAIIDCLYKQVNTTKDNFNINFIKSQLIKPTKKQIINASIKSEKHYKFEDKEISVFDSEILKIKHFEKLDSFINLNKPDPKLIFVNTDAWNEFSIVFIHNIDSTRYKANFYKLLGQPFALISRKGNNFVQNINLEINKTVAHILPNSSSLKKAIDINSLTEQYINWYLDKIL